MAVQILLQPAHGYVPLLVVLMAFVNLWASVKVGEARRKYNILYPQMYAEQSDKNAKAFNCVQRAHQNLVENMPVFYATLLTSSIFRPEMAAIVGLVRILGFILYVRGYSTGEPTKRFQGSFGNMATLIGVGMSVEAGLKLLGRL